MKTVLEGPAGFVLPMLRGGMRVLDAGCGCGVATRHLATAAHPIHVLGLESDLDELVQAQRSTRQAAISTAGFACTHPHRLPVSTGSVDVVFCHDLLEHLPNRTAVLHEFFRVLRPGGTVAVSVADWGHASLTPRTMNIDAALRGRNLVQKRAGGEPFGGRYLPEWLESAGFRDIRSHTRYDENRDYRQLAQSVEACLAAAIQDPDVGRDPQLASAARSARMWAHGPPGDFSQCWVETTAVR